MAELEIGWEQYLELEKLALGTFSPLSGFMNEAELRSVVSDLSLPDGQVFPLPVVLDVDPDQAAAIKGRPRVTLIHAGCEVGELDPQSIYRVDREKLCGPVFGTTDTAHPGVAHFLAQRELLVGGPVTLKQRLQRTMLDVELTPAESRAHFEERGWKTVVGFQTRNVPHRAHEHLIMLGLEEADGVFIQPLIGWRKAGDYTPEAILEGYQVLLNDFLPQGRATLAFLSTAMRYAGPREAVFHAIIRRNHGCSHFIVGRDHAGVGSYYDRYAAHRLTAELEDRLDITILRMPGPYLCRQCGGVVTERSCTHPLGSSPHASEISGSLVREALASGAALDAEMMRPEVVAALREVPLFVNGTVS